jgi:hypothetical protein
MPQCTSIQRSNKGKKNTNKAKANAKAKVYHPDRMRAGSRTKQISLSSSWALITFMDRA